MALDNSKLEKYLKDFSEVADDWFIKPWLKERYEFFTGFCRPEHLDRATWDDIQKIGEKIHSFTALPIARSNALGRPNHPIEHYRDSFKYLAHGEGDTFERINRFTSDPKYKLKYFGRGAISEIAGYLFAEQVMFLNTRDVKAAEFFGITWKKKRGEKLGDELRSFTEAVRPVLESYERIVGWRTDVPKYLELDQFFSWWYEEERGGPPPPSPPPPPKRSLPCNLVLYGPPGTGKTYRTVDLALEICHPGQTAPEDRRAAVAEFRRLMEEGRVSVVTFHQSYGYEEFVEGIRPEVQKGGEDDGGLRYTIKDGVFKRICISAKEAISRDRRGYDFDTEKIKIWKMSLGNTLDPADAHIFDSCIEDGYVLLGWGDGLDFTDADSWDKVRELLRQKDPKIADSDYRITSVNMFRNLMKEGDLVVVTEGNHKFRAIGRINGPYKHMGEMEYGQCRPVDWLAVYEESLPKERILKKAFSQQTLYQLKPEVLKLEALRELLSGTKPMEAKSFVLIIDELNRGNISKILGELITLIEDDKRLGAENELTVTLPYSGEPFGVPPNLYILGTMNSADRSIAFIDTALRRRFEFREVAPESDVLRTMMPDQGVIDDVDVPSLLDVLNDRIELMFDRDHRLGHSYFIRVESLDQLRQVFLERVLPLLQEYFYDDWQRICLVLGCPYSTEGESPETRNPHPIFVSQRLSAAGLLGMDSGEYEDQVRYLVNPEFEAASGTALAEFFFSMMGPASQAT